MSDNNIFIKKILSQSRLIFGKVSLNPIHVYSGGFFVAFGWPFGGISKNIG